MAAIFQLPGAQIVDADGDPYSGARLYFYSPGTTTPLNVYANEALTTPLAQPVSADSAGRWPLIFMQPTTFRVQVKTSADVLINDYDNVDPGFAVGAGALPISKGGTGGTTQASAIAGLGLASFFLSFTGGTLTGDITRSGPAGSFRQFLLRTATFLRWAFGADNSAEAGANAGSKFFLDCYDDGGSLLRRAIEIERAAGAITINGSVAVSGDIKSGGFRAGRPDMHVRDLEPSGTNGGTFTQGADRTRVLNTIVVNNITGAGLATNQITLPIGTFYIQWRTPGVAVVAHQSILYNITAAAAALTGSSTSSGPNSSTDSVGSGTLVLAAPTVFEIRHRCATSNATVGLGSASSFYGNEIYAEVMIWRLA